jgi:hypothetical protein
LDRDGCTLLGGLDIGREGSRQEKWGAEGVSLPSSSLLAYQGLLRTSYRSIFLGARQGVAVGGEKVRGNGREWPNPGRQALQEWLGHLSLQGGHPTPCTPGWVDWEMDKMGCWVDREDELEPTWIVASDSCGTAKDLPQQCGILPAILNEYILQSLCPVKLIEDNGGWGERGSRGLGGESWPVPC